MRTAAAADAGAARTADAAARMATRVGRARATRCGGQGVRGIGKMRAFLQIIYGVTLRDQGMVD
jgi:hypothetical protein